MDSELQAAINLLSDHRNFHTFGEVLSAFNVIVEAARKVANPDIEAAAKALRRFVKAFEGEDDKPYGSAVEVVLFTALGITENTDTDGD